MQIQGALCWGWCRSSAGQLAAPFLAWWCPVRDPEARLASACLPFSSAAACSLRPDHGAFYWGWCQPNPRGRREDWFVFPNHSVQCSSKTVNSFSREKRHSSGSFWVQPRVLYARLMLGRVVLPVFGGQGECTFSSWFCKNRSAGPWEMGPRAVWNVSSGLGTQKPTFLISSAMPPGSAPIGFRMP